MSNSEIDELRIEHEREKWRDELKLRDRELAIREREQLVREDELRVRAQEAKAISMD
jgi:hypothetical protein